MQEQEQKEHDIFAAADIGGLLDLAAASGASPSATPRWSSIYIPLGYTETHSVVWTIDGPKNERLAFLDAGQLSKPLRLVHFFRKDSIQASYPKIRMTKEGEIVSPDFEAFSMELVETCREMGCYSGHKEVAAGVWVAPDNDDVLVVNSMTLKRTDGKAIGRMEAGRREIYQGGGNFGDPLGVPPAETSAVREVVRALRTWGWEKRSDALLMLGWLAVASYTGALQWRPHVYLTAEPGYGKSGLQKLIFNLKPRDETEERGVLDGGTTEAGLRQKLKSKALALVIDEREANDEKKDASFDQLLTSASSGSTIAKGTANQVGREDEITFTAFMTGVNPPSRSAPLASRCAVLTFDKRPKGGGILPSLLEDTSSARKLQQPLFSRMLHAWPAFQANLKEVRKSLAEAGCDSRIQDTYGTLIAGAITMRFAKTIKPHWIGAIVKGFDLAAHIEASTRSAKADCLSHLLEQSLRDEVDTGSALYPVRGPIVEIATKALFGETGQENTAYATALERVGLKPKIGDDGQILLFVANRHDQLSKLFAGTAWTKSYAPQLHRIQGVEKADSFIRFCGRNCRGRWIPTGIFPEAAKPAVEEKSPF